ncbi:MAG: hypothetical protein AB7Q97_19830 [Gammaproteobacteria bacterium]
MLQRIIAAGRLGRAAALAAGSLVLFAWLALNDSGSPVMHGTATGRIVESRPASYLVELEDRRRVRVFGTGALEAGRRVSLEFERYADGGEYFRLPDGEEAGR